MTALEDLRLLFLLQLADSALPIGALSHSFGLETLVEQSPNLDAAAIRELMAAYLEEPMLLEAVFCRAGHRCGGDTAAMRELNQVLSARKAAREAREASLVLGRRFTQLMRACTKDQLGMELDEDGHFSLSFGVVCRALDIPEESCILAFLEQSCASVLSSLVRLMPLGQVSASVILWELKERIAQTCRKSRDGDPRQIPCFSPSLEIGSMRHPRLETRLFVS